MIKFSEENKGMLIAKKDIAAVFTDKRLYKDI